MSENVGKFGRAGGTRDDKIIQRTRFVFWINKATDTHSKYVIFNKFPRQKQFQESAVTCIFVSKVSAFLQTFMACR